MRALALFATASAPLALGLYALLPTAADARQDQVVTAPLPPGPHPAPLAVNVPELHYWAAQQVYSNLFKQASRWHREDLSTWALDSGPPLALDEDGWVTELLPNQAASVLIARGPDGLLAAGTYELPRRPEHLLSGLFGGQRSGRRLDGLPAQVIDAVHHHEGESQRQRCQ